MAYATAQQLVDRFDVNLIGDLCTDTNTRVGLSAILTNTRVAACLDDSAAEINRAARQGDRYSAADLAALASNGDTSLIRLNSELALGMLYEARGIGIPEGHYRTISRARTTLESLRSGEQILGVAENIDAGIPSSQTPSTAFRQDSAYMGSAYTGGFFPTPPSRNT
jgi:phage gp36-like protein